MYNAYFNFSCSPFENTLDQRFLFFSEGHDEVISALLYFIKAKKSFALVCGDVGTGKTMIVHHLLGKLPPTVQPILIPFPDVEYIEILRYIARVLRINPDGKRVLELTDEVKAALTKASLDGRQVVLIIDEAHLLSIGSLEYIRLLSNMETSESKLLQILLIGQNELSHKLRRKEMRQLRQRININRFLAPMSAAETVKYIDHRLEVAGSSFDTCFDPACKKSLHKMTGGVPRSINQLCDTALLVCMAEKGEKVTGKILSKAHDALSSDMIFTPGEAPSNKLHYVKGLRPVLAGGALVILLALGILGYNGKLGGNLENWVHEPDSPKAVTTSVEKHQLPALEMKSQEASKPEEASKLTETVKQGTPDGVPSMKAESTSVEQHQVPDSAKSVEVSAPAQAEGKSSPNLSHPEEPQIPSSAAKSPRLIPEQGESARKDEGKTSVPDTTLPPIEKAGGNPTAPEKTQTKAPMPAANPVSGQSQGDVNAAIAPATKNPKTDAQDRELERQAAGTEGFTITVQEGDTLSGIAARFFPENPVSGQRAILAANPQISNKDYIQAGQSLRIPKSEKIAP